MRVRVEDAPGYEDFEGELIMQVQSVTGELMCVVGCEWEGRREVNIFHSRYVQEV